MEFKIGGPCAQVYMSNFYVTFLLACVDDKN